MCVGRELLYTYNLSFQQISPGALPATCVSTVAMFVVDYKSAVIKLTAEELETHLLGKEFSEKTTNVLRGTFFSFVSFYLPMVLPVANKSNQFLYLSKHIFGKTSVEQVKIIFPRFFKQSLKLAMSNSLLTRKSIEQVQIKTLQRRILNVSFVW